MLKKELDDLIQDYGYYRAFEDPKQLVGRSSMMVEYMAVLPKPGKKQALINAAAKLNVLLNEEQKIMPDAKTPQTVLVFNTHYQPVFKEIVRDVVKSRNSR